MRTKPGKLLFLLSAAQSTLLLRQLRIQRALLIDQLVALLLPEIGRLRIAQRREQLFVDADHTQAKLDT